MSRRYTSYYPLALALLFGLAISLIPISPALSDNIGACQGNNNSATHLTLGGRTITPSLILQAAGSQPCPAGETSLSLAAFSHTIIVSSNGTPAHNGSALLAAMNLISNSNPSAANPWLLKLEPGNYDLGSQFVTMLPFVDLEGSGEGTTVISSTIGSSNFPPTVATLVAASNSEVRFLKITNTGSDTYQTGVLVPNASIINNHFSHFTAEASYGSVNYGFFNNNGTSTIINSTIIGSGGSFSNGLYNNGGTLTVTSSNLSSSYAAPTNTSLYNNGGSSTIANSTLTVVSIIPSSNRGVYNNSGTSMVINSVINASGGSYDFGLENIEGVLTVTNSTLKASDGSESNYSVINFGGGASTKVLNSALNTSGGVNSTGLVALNGTAQVANSQLSGTTAASSGLTICPNTYDGNFVPLTNGVCH